MDQNDVKALVARFYDDALTVNSRTTSTAVLEEILAPGFLSINSHEVKPKAVLINQVELFWRLIPDLRWKPEDILVSGAKVVVRSVASGSPNGAFMGLELDGTKTFRIDTTDIHEIEGGRIARVHHLEDWATAMKQLSPRRSALANHCVEVATFKLKADVAEEMLLGVEARVRAGQIAKQPGFISRELARGEAEGEWLMVLRFETRAQMDAWMTSLKSVPEMREMGALIEPGSMKTWFFNHAEPLAPPRPGAS
jgi:predicted ester cyclase/heme-degrading monooxygenase HmoA